MNNTSLLVVDDSSQLRSSWQASRYGSRNISLPLTYFQTMLGGKRSSRVTTLFYLLYLLSFESKNWSKNICFCAYTVAPTNTENAPVVNQEIWINKTPLLLTMLKAQRKQQNFEKVSKCLSQSFAKYLGNRANIRTYCDVILALPNYFRWKWSKLEKQLELFLCFGLIFLILYFKLKLNMRLKYH